MIRKLIAIVVVALVVYLVVARTAPPPVATVAPAPVAVTQPSRAQARPEVAHSSVGFRSRDRLVEHYQKHGAEFKGASINEYLHMAQALRDGPAGGHILEVIRPSDGVVSRFDKSTGAFLAFDADGTIRTFFKPNDGESYFRRQAKRRPTP